MFKIAKNALFQVTVRTEKGDGARTPLAGIEACLRSVFEDYAGLPPKRDCAADRGAVHHLAGRSRNAKPHQNTPLKQLARGLWFDLPHGRCAREQDVLRRIVRGMPEDLGRRQLHQRAGLVNVAMQPFIPLVAFKWNNCALILLAQRENRPGPAVHLRLVHQGQQRVAVAVLRQHGVVGHHLAGFRVRPLRPDARQRPSLTIGARKAPGNALNFGIMSGVIRLDKAFGRD